MIGRTRRFRNSLAEVHVATKAQPLIDGNTLRDGTRATIGGLCAPLWARRGAVTASCTLYAVCCVWRGVAFRSSRLPLRPVAAALQMLGIGMLILPPGMAILGRSTAFGNATFEWHSLAARRRVWTGWVGRGAGMKITAGAKPAIANNTIVGNTAETLFVSKTAKVRAGAHHAIRNMQPPFATQQDIHRSHQSVLSHARPAPSVRQRSVGAVRARSQI